jgi:hypothetical protein
MMKKKKPTMMRRWRMTSRRSNLYHIFRSFFLFGVLMPKGVEKLSGQYLSLICDESLTC